MLQPKLLEVLITNQVRGNVVHKETNEGLPNLLVVIYDFDPEIDISSILNSEGNPQSVRLIENSKIFRLGPVLTDADGLFELEFADEDFKRTTKMNCGPISSFAYFPRREVPKQNRPSFMHLQNPLQRGSLRNLSHSHHNCTA